MKKILKLFKRPFTDTTNLSPKEYLYIDLGRLQSYYEQIKVGGLTSDTIPTYKSGISLTGPSTEVTRQTVVRKPTEYEMIKELLEHLRDNNQLAKGRDYFINEPYAFDSFLANKVTIFSSKTLQIQGREHLSLWISGKIPIPHPSPGIKNMRFYIIESTTEYDRMPEHGLSGFGALQSLLTIEFTRSVLANNMSLSENELGKRRNLFGGILSKEHTWKMFSFERDPVNFLKEMGAHIGDERNIEVLYRRRYSAYGFEYDDVRNSPAIGNEFGYPVYIALNE